MRSRYFALILSFTVIAVAATAINCGCAYAALSSASQIEKAVRHCEQHEEDEAKAESEECCLGCQLGIGALNLHRLDFQSNRSKEFLLLNAFLTKNVLRIVSKNHLISAPFHSLDARGVSIPTSEHPIYLILESFLI